MPWKIEAVLVVALLSSIAVAAGDPGVAIPREPAPGDAEVPAEGVFVRHWRLQVAPASVDGFESLLKLYASAATAADIRPGLLYREPPAGYWIVEISPEREGFVAADTFEHLVRSLAEATSPAALADAERMLAESDYRTEWVVIARQHSGWSTVDGMSTSTHPMARLVDFRIKAGKDGDFNQAMAAYARFLTERDYGLPIESFAIADADPGRAWMVIFPTDWVSFHASDSLERFAGALPPETAEEFMALEAALAETVSSIDHYDASFAADL